MMKKMGANSYSTRRNSKKEEDIEEDIMFNQEIKEKFIMLQENIDTQIVYRSVLSSCYDFEKELNKDVYEFNISEMRILFKKFDANSYNSIRHKTSIIYNYMKFIYEDGITTKPPMHFFRGREALEQFVNKVDKIQKYITKDNLYIDIHNILVNAQDEAIFVLLFEGFKNLEEISNLVKKDISVESQTVRINSGKSPRTIKVSKQAMYVIEEAMNEDVYVKNNGVFEEMPLYPEALLEDTPYIIKPTRAKNKTEYQCTSNRIRQRFDKTKRILDLHLVTPKSIWESGIYEFVKDINGLLSMAECEIVNNRFAIVERAVEKEDVYTIRKKVAELKKYLDVKTNE